MSAKNTLTVNIIIWAEIKEKATILAAKLTRGKKNLTEETFESIILYPDPFKIKDCKIHLKAYTRWPEYFTKSSPEPITDILIINISSPSSKFFRDALKYLNTRRGIPFRYLVSEYNLTKISKDIDCEFYTENEMLSENTLKKFLKNSFNIDYTLFKVFEKFDIDHNGFIEKFELLEMSNEIAYKLTPEEINEILTNLSRDRKISYEQFKKWWVIGRKDFLSLRRIVDIHLTMNNFILETNSYLEKLRTEVELISSINIRHEGKILIACEEENLIPYPHREISSTLPYKSSNQNSNFDFTKINLKLVNGIEVDSMLETFPDYLKLNPFSFGIEFNLFDSNSGIEVIEVLKKLYSKIIQIPFLRETLNYFVQVNFRHVDMSVILDVNLKSDLYLKHNIMRKLLEINLDQLMKKFIGTSNFYFMSGIKLAELFDIDFLHFLEKICKFKIDCHGEFSHIKHFTKIIWSIFESLTEKELDSYWLNLHNIINLISNVTKLHLDLKYDHKSLFESLKEIISKNFVRKFKLNEQVSNMSEINNLGLLRAQEEFNILRNYFGKFLDKFFDANYKSFIKNNVRNLKKINFDKVELYFIWPKIKLFMKSGLMSDGITKYINNKYL